MDPQDFDFELPAELIAQQPLPTRSASRLLVLNGDDGNPRDLRMIDLAGQLSAGDLVVVNDTRVLPARFYGKKETGGRIECLLERITGPTSGLFQLKASRAPGVGSRILFESAAATVTSREGRFFVLEFDRDLEPFVSAEGTTPLPPYIERAPEKLDADRYQTVFAAEPGAVAAPTAGLHFDHELLESLAARGIELARLTLHVGAGTFAPLGPEQLETRRLHAERVSVTQQLVDAIAETRARGGRVVAVGTTTVRALESAALQGELKPLTGETTLFITPGFHFRVIDAIVTNFHLPRSSLLMLVAAFAGRDAILRAYAHAVRERYRFFSYGDAMLIFPSEHDAV